MNQPINVSRAALVRLLDAVLYLTRTIPAVRAPRGDRTVLLVRLSAGFCATCRGFCSILSPFHPETSVWLSAGLCATCHGFCSTLSPFHPEKLALCKRYSDDLEEAGLAFC